MIPFGEILQWQATVVSVFLCLAPAAAHHFKTLRQIRIMAPGGLARYRSKSYSRTFWVKIPQPWAFTIFRLTILDQAFLTFKSRAWEVVLVDSTRRHLIFITSIWKEAKATRRQQWCK